MTRENRTSQKSGCGWRKVTSAHDDIAVTDYKLDMDNWKNVGALPQVSYCLLQHSAGVCCTLDSVCEFLCTRFLSRKTIGNCDYNGHVNIDNGVPIGNKQSYRFNLSTGWPYLCWTLFRCHPVSQYDIHRRAERKSVMDYTVTLLTPCDGSKSHWVWWMILAAKKCR